MERQPEPRKRRAPMACEFCRHRKMKCNNKKPSCHNCKEHGKSCVYAELEKRPRPSFAKISLLEHENRCLKAQIADLQQRIGASDNSDTAPLNTPSLVLTQDPVQKPNEECGRNHCSTPSNRSQVPADLAHAGFAKRGFSPDKESSYHGPTSAVFDEHNTETSSQKHRGNSTKLPDVWVKRQLVAESTNQRQLETVNLLAGKLDFDGIEPNLAMHLLSIYWSRQQHIGPVVYRPAFMRDMACAGPYFSKLLLNALYFYASKYTTRVEVRHNLNDRLTAGWVFRGRAVNLLRDSFETSKITTIQALLIMSSALFTWCDEKSKAWLYAGMAFNMVIDLGLHVEANTLKQRFCEEELEIRRRVFWSAYVIDKLQSLYQGRPAALRNQVTNAQLTIVDDHEELELFDSLSYTERTLPISPAYTLSTFIATCKLSLIMDKILMTLYSENSSSRDPAMLLQECKSLHIELEEWREALPQNLEFKSSSPVSKTPLPHTLALFATFNVLLILLHRPFVSDGHLHSTSPSIALDAFSACCNSAFEIDHILKTYEEFFSFLSTPNIIAYATYVSATIHVRLAAQKEPGSDAHKALSRCMDIIELQQTTCWSVRRAKRIIDGLIARTGVVFDCPNRAEFGDILSSDFDIDAIIRTFAQQQAEVVQSQGFTAGTMITEQELPALGEDVDFLDDPIFGFNGTAFDDLDFGYDIQDGSQS